MPSFHLGLIVTGGTIASLTRANVLELGDEERVAAQGVQLVKSAWCGPGELDITVRAPLDIYSENLVPLHWNIIAQHARRLVDEDHVGGVLVLHGTDTMSYSSAAFSFVLADLNVPIVITGANIPAGTKDSDAEKNVHDSIIALCSVSRGTYLVFAGAANLPGIVHLGTKVRKARTSGASFESVNREPVAVVMGERFEPRAGPLPTMACPPLPQGSFGDPEQQRILAFELYPGLDLSLFAHLIEQAGLRGVIIGLYPSATGPDSTSLMTLPRFIDECRQRELCVFCTVPTFTFGRHYRYKSEIAIEQAGGVFLRDMIHETAIVKLMWALSFSRHGDDLKGIMLSPIAGEITCDDSV